MSPESFASLYALVSPFSRSGGPGGGRRCCVLKPTIKLLLTLYWFAHGGSQLAMNYGADVPSSSFSGIVLAVTAAIRSGLPPPSVPTAAAQHSRWLTTLWRCMGAPAVVWWVSLMVLVCLSARLLAWYCSLLNFSGLSPNRA